MRTLAERQGIAEIKYINGLYATLDELLDRFPGLVIDNCASGGRRLDYEMCRRSVPLFRTDYFVRCGQKKRSRFRPKMKASPAGYRFTAPTLEAKKFTGSVLTISGAIWRRQWDWRSTRECRTKRKKNGIPICWGRQSACGPS